MVESACSLVILAGTGTTGSRSGDTLGTLRGVVKCALTGGVPALAVKCALSGGVVMEKGGVVVERLEERESLIPSCCGPVMGLEVPG